MASHKAYDTPVKTTAIDGEVVLEGPDGIGLSMTPDAAEETARRLQAASEIARSQSTENTSGDNDA
jgi:hypothetical protein